jgi:hypothetical protein
MRTFTVESVSRGGRKMRFAGGRYQSSTPSSAASKAFSQITRHYGLTGRITLEVHIRETTQDSLHKSFAYKVSRVKADKPAPWIPVTPGEDQIVFSYVTKVKAL